MAAGRESRKERLMDRIKAEKETPVYEERVSVRLTGNGMERLQKAAAKVEIPYTRLAAILVDEGVDIILET